MFLLLGEKQGKIVSIDCLVFDMSKSYKNKNLKELFYRNGPWGGTGLGAIL